jgi:hypothetical protein
MLNFFCSICIDDRIQHPEQIVPDFAYATCAECGSKMDTTYTRPEAPTEQMLTLEAYNEIHGLDNN